MSGARLLMGAEEVAAKRGKWLERRADPDTITASEIAAIMDLAPPEYGSAFSVWVEKTQGPDLDTPPTAQMKRGTHLEPVVVDMLRDDHPDIAAGLLPGGLYQNVDRPWQVATFDKLHRDGYPVELKTVEDDDPPEPLRKWGAPGSAVVPLHIRIQGLWQFSTADEDEVLIPALKMRSWRLHLYRIERDAAAERDLELMFAAAEEFRGFVRSGTPPPLTWAPATERALKRLHPELEDRAVRVPVSLARRRVRAYEAVKAAERRLALADNELRFRMGSAREAVALDDEGKLRRVVLRSKYDRQPYAVTKVSHVDSLRAGDWRGEPR